MDFGGHSFIVAIVALSMGAWVITTWLRVKHGYPLTDDDGNAVHRTDPDADRKVALLANENEKLIGKISRLEERIAVLERIATEPSTRTARAIDELR